MRGGSLLLGVLTLWLVRRGVGASGANTDYVLNTATHLRGLGIRDRALEALAKALEGDAASLDSRRT